MRSRRAVCLVALLCAGLLACAELTQRMARIGIPGVEGGATEADLRQGLASLSSGFASLVTAASDRIRSASRLRVTRRNTLLWQLRMIPLAHQAAFLPDVQQAYVASLALVNAQQAYLLTGEGSALFGAQQPIAVDAADQLERDMVALGSEFLSERQLARLQKQVDELVAAHPIRGVFSADSLITGLSTTTAGGMFTWVVDLPMVPFRALSGVTDTAQAINDFNETARAFTQTINELPHQTRWELELLLYDAEELEAVDRALAAGEAVALAADRISLVAEKLPEELGAELAARLDEARATIVELNAALERAEGVSGSLVHVSDRVGDASAQWTALLTEMRAGGGGDGRAFDVREYEATAERISDAGRELRGLVSDLRSLDPATSRSLLDAAAWRAALLIGVFFAGLIVYRVVVSRLRR
jgi:Rad3-related DNA helicase